MSKTKKILLLILVIVASAFMHGFYYNHNNSANRLNAIRDSISGLIDRSAKESPSVHSAYIENCKTALAGNKYTNESQALKSWFNNTFLPKWKTDSILKPVQIEAFKKENQDYFKNLIGSEAVRGATFNEGAGSFAMFGLFVLFLLLALFSNILRDAVSDPLLKQQIQKGDCFPPFSLARTQLAVWITIIASCYIHAVLWRQCSLADIPINSTALILMGISAGTFVTGAIIDTVEIEQGVPRSQDQLSSGNFLKDILSDSQGISIHRFQNLVWTIVAIIVYVYAYNNHLTKGCLPDLDSTLLALTGISSATYLTLKSRENIFSEVKIHLDFDPSVKGSKPDVDSNGWTDINVTIQDITGKKVIATPDPVSHYDFSIKGLTPGKYSIAVNAKAKISGTDTAFAGTFNDIINSTTSQPIVIVIR